MKDINLLPSFIEKKDDALKLTRIIVLLLIVLSLGSVAGAVMYLESATVELDAQIDEVESEIIRLSQVEVLEKELNKKSLEFRTTLDMVDKFERDCIINYQLLQEISSALPEYAFLSNYSVSEEKALELQGSSKSEKDTIYLVSKLKALKSVKKVNFNSLTRLGGKDPYYNFELTIDLN